MNTLEVLNKKYLPLLRELIRNACVNTGDPESGHEIRSVETLARFFHAHGIEPEILGVNDERANLIVRVKGTRPGAPSLAFMGHLDVVPATPAGWTCPPFAAEIRDGILYGRGSVDMLNMTAGMAVAFVEHLAENGPPPGDLVFIACADEEQSGRLGGSWLTEHHWDKVKADSMITELGGFFTAGRRRPGILVTVGEKGLSWMDLCAGGTAGHGSMPYGADSAAVEIAAAVQRIAAYKGRIKLNATYRAMADGMAHGAFQRIALKSGIRCLMNTALASIAKKNPGEAKFLHAAVRRTFMPNIVSVGRKVNMIPDTGRIQIDGRILPGDDPSVAEREIRKLLGPLSSQFALSVTDYFPSFVSPIDTPLFRAVSAVVADHYPGHDLVPLFISGVTDGRFWRSRGTVVYGFSLFDPEMTTDAYASRLHGKDERISIASLQKTLEFFHELPGRFFKEMEKKD